MDEQLVVVSGGGSGIGAAVALQQAGLGRRVLVTGRRADRLAATAAGAGSGASPVETVCADLSTPAGAAAVASAVGDRRVIGLVAAAGSQAPFRTSSPDLNEVDRVWEEALRLNLFSAVLLVEALLPRLSDQRARVVLVGSTAGLNGAGGAYAAAKAALHSYGRSLARTLGPRGITANVVAPGFVVGTDFFDVLDAPPDAGALARSAARTMVGRLGETADITGCIDWLLSAGAGWTTGQVISPNGGVVLVR